MACACFLPCPAHKPKPDLPKVNAKPPSGVLRSIDFWDPGRTLPAVLQGVRGAPATGQKQEVNDMDRDEAKEKALGKGEKAAGKREKGQVRRTNGSRALKQHLKYIVPQIRLVMVREPGPVPRVIKTPECLGPLMEPLRHYSEEHFIAFHLDARHHVIGYHEVSHGTLSASLVHPREVFKAALLANSYAIIVAHNHPAGTLKASPEDIETTKTLIAAGKLLGVSVLDHVIVTSLGIYSMRDNLDSLWY